MHILFDEQAIYKKSTKMVKGLLDEVEYNDHGQQGKQHVNKSK